MAQLRNAILWARASKPARAEFDQRIVPLLAPLGQETAGELADAIWALLALGDTGDHPGVATLGRVTRVIDAGDALEVWLDDRLAVFLSGGTCGDVQPGDRVAYWEPVGSPGKYQLRCYGPDLSGCVPATLQRVVAGGEGQVIVEVEVQTYLGSGTVLAIAATDVATALLTGELEAGGAVLAVLGEPTIAYLGKTPVPVSERGIPAVPDTEGGVS
jgi:hypothetical protein